ncbi:hypothetical protein [Microbulbifer sp. A4B17]|uniref:hypothetical protein n=1 Tax=Microbulbifer sp. A4B17 TaxID=359370 RepID=UPI001300BB47|nr:hypothetical protein [Microbulbifer sp. A4B17]
MKNIAPLSAGTALAIISHGAIADSNTATVYQEGISNTATAVQSDPTATNNTIDQTQIGDNNTSYAEQSANSDGGTIIHIQTGDMNNAESYQDNSVGAYIEINQGDNNQYVFTNQSFIDGSSMSITQDGDGQTAIANQVGTANIGNIFQ